MEGASFSFFSNDVCAFWRGSNRQYLPCISCPFPKVEDGRIGNNLFYSMLVWQRRIIKDALAFGRPWTILFGLGLPVHIFLLRKISGALHMSIC